MKRLMTGLTLAVSMLALGACGDKGASSKTDAAPVPAEPHVRNGLWELTIAVSGSPAQTLRTCSDDAHSAPVLGASQCSDARRTLRPDGSWAIEATCDRGASGVVHMSGEMRGDPNTAYTVTLQTTISGAANAQLNTSESVSLNAKWISGVCPADLKPGAIETPQGIIDSSAMKGKG